MFGLFKSNTRNKLQKQYEAKMAEATQAQRSGDIRLYSELSEQADSLLKKIDEAENEQNKSA